MILEISNNSTSIYRSCPKKYYWNYIKGLKPYKKSSALTLGSIVHSAFDMYYNGFSDLEVLKYINDTSNENIAKASPEEEESLVIVKYTALAMWLSYPKDLSVFEEIKPEVEMKVELFPGVEVLLKIDGLVKQNGKYWIRELKTTGMSFSQFENRCKSSPQCSLYTWAVRKSGIPVEGVIYDFIKKPLLRKRVNDTKDDFGKRIVDDMKTRPEFYFKRHYSYRSDEELELFQADITLTAKDMLERFKSNEWYRNPDACWNFNSACQYMPICFAKKPDKLTMDIHYEQKPINPEKGGKPCQNKTK